MALKLNVCSIAKIRETGLLIKYIKYQDRLRINNCPTNVKPSYREDLGVGDIFSGFIILVAGHLIAFSVLGVEVFNQKVLPCVSKVVKV